MSDDRKQINSRLRTVVKYNERFWIASDSENSSRQKNFISLSKPNVSLNVENTDTTRGLLQYHKIDQELATDPRATMILLSFERPTILDIVPRNRYPFDRSTLSPFSFESKCMQEVGSGVVEPFLVNEIQEDQLILRSPSQRIHREYIKVR